MPLNDRRPRAKRGARRLATLGVVAGLVLGACSSSTTRSASEADESTSTTVDGSTSTSSTSSSTTTTSSTSSTTLAPAPIEPIEPIQPESTLFPCASSVVMGPMGMQAVDPTTCLVRTGLEWSTDRAVTVGGIDFRPVAPGARVVFDPFNARVASIGYEAYGTVFGAPLLLASGVIDWSFQYTPSQNGPIGAAMPSSSETVSLITVGRLPGLSGVATFPKQPVTGFADYSVVTDDSVRQLATRFSSLATPDVVFPLDAIGLRTIPKYSFSVPSVAVQELAGLNVTGSFSVQPVSRNGRIGTTVSTSLALPEWLSGIEAEFAAFFPVNGDAELDRLLVDVKLIDLGIVRFTNVYLLYDLATDTWTGRVGVLFGSGANPVGLSGRMSIVAGDLQNVGVTLTGLPIPIGSVATINALGGTLTIEPTGVRAIGQLGIGPMVADVGNVAVADGELVIDEQELSLTGSVTVGSVKIRDYEVKGIRVANARIAYYWDGLMSISGTGQFFLDKAETWGLRGGLRGGATADAVSLGGDVVIGLGPLVTLNGSVAVSSRGMIACGTVRGLWFSEARLGISYDWGAPAALIRGRECNTEQYQVPLVSAGAAAAPGRNAAGDDEPVRTAVVAAGERMVTFAIGGAGATVVGPDGTRIAVTGAEQSSQSDPDDPRWIVIRQPGDTTSYVFVGQPAAGQWKVLTSDATAPVEASVVSASSRPKDAPTETLRPTSARQPLSTGSVVVTSTDVGASWLRIVLVLVGLGLALVVVMVVRRRPAA